MKPRPATIEAIVSRAASEHGVSVDAVMGRDRSRRATRARHSVWRRLRAFPFRMTVEAIGDLFGRDHSTVVVALWTEERRLAKAVRRKLADHERESRAA